MTEVRVPDLGDFSNVEIIEVLVAAGDDLAKEQGLITLETDKATMDVPSPIKGKLLELKVGVGDKVSMGDLIAVVEADGDKGQEQGQAEGETSKDGGEPDGDHGEKEQAPAAAPAAAAGPVTVHVPDLGDFADVEIIEVLVAVGDEVKKEQGLITLETDKATMDVPSEADGTVAELLVKVGDKVSKGDAIARLDGSAGASGVEPSKKAEAAPAPAAAQQEPAPAPAPPARPQPTRTASAPSAGEQGKTVHASPSVRKIAREFGVDLAKVSGSGAKGRVIKEDIQDYVKTKLSGDSGGAMGIRLGYELPDGVDDPAKHGEVEMQDLSRIKQISGPFLHRNWLAIPHVTQHAEADVSELETFRKAHTDAAKAKGFALSPLAFVLKATTVALSHYPSFNAQLSEDGKSIAVKKYMNIGIAVDTEGGLVVPVLRDANALSVMQIAEQLGTMSSKARAGKLGPNEMKGGTFTISSLGGIGGSFFTPIINAPEVAILGVGRSSQQPVWDGAAFKPRLMMPLSLSYDHRVIDGAQGARFITHLAELLSDIRNIVL